MSQFHGQQRLHMWTVDVSYYIQKTLIVQLYAQCAHWRHYLNYYSYSSRAPYTVILHTRTTNQEHTRRTCVTHRWSFNKQRESTVTIL